MEQSDARIREALQLELGADSRLRAAGVGVAVAESVVTLTGTVRSDAERLAAQEAAHRVGGVLDVADELRVRPPHAGERTDTEVALWVRRALRGWSDLPAERIRSTVAGGWVTLEGAVDRAEQRQDAERVVAALRGVRGVTNRVAVEPRPTQDVQVWLHDGVATVAGRVHSVEERAEVLAAVRERVGGREIDDQLLLWPVA